VVGILSSVVPNIPLVVAMVLLLKKYIVNVGLAPAEVLAPDCQGQFPPEVLPLFYLCNDVWRNFGRKWYFSGSIF
jgi:hypothetical protein